MPSETGQEPEEQLVEVQPIEPDVLTASEVAIAPSAVEVSVGLAAEGPALVEAAPQSAGEGVTGQASGNAGEGAHAPKSNGLPNESENGDNKGQAVESVTSEQHPTSVSPLAPPDATTTDEACSNAAAKAEKDEEEPKTHHDALVRYFTKHNTDNLPKISKLLATYKGKEAKLYANLEQKYGEPVPGAATLCKDPDKPAKDSKESAGTRTAGRRKSISASDNAKQPSRSRSPPKNSPVKAPRLSLGGIAPRDGPKSGRRTSTSRGTGPEPAVTGRTQREGVEKPSVRTPREGTTSARGGARTPRDGTGTKTPREGARTPREGTGTQTPREGTGTKTLRDGAKTPREGGSRTTRQPSQAQSKAPGESVRGSRAMSAGSRKPATAARKSAESAGTQKTESVRPRRESAPSGGSVKGASAKKPSPKKGSNEKGPATKSAAPAERERYRVAMVIYLNQVNPEKVDQVDKFLDFYAAKPGGWAAMCTKFEEKYGVKMTHTEGSADTPAFAAAVNEAVNTVMQSAATQEDSVDPKTARASRLAEMRAKVAAAEQARSHK